MQPSSCAVLVFVALMGACSSSSSEETPPPIVTSGSYWKSSTQGVPNLQLAADGTGKMSFQAGGSTPSFEPVQLTWKKLAADSISVTLKTGPAPAAPSGFQATFAGNDPGAKPGRIQLSWSPVDGAEWYNVYKASGSNAPALQAQFLTTTSLTDDGFPSPCGFGPAPNYDNDYAFTVKAVRGWIEGPSSAASATVSGNPRPGGGAPSEGCTISPNAAPTSNQSVVTLNPTRFSKIVVDDPSNPSSLSATVVTANGTSTWKFQAASGAL